jgi:hypothetical protein
MGSAGAHARAWACSARVCDARLQEARAGTALEESRKVVGAGMDAYLVKIGGSGMRGNSSFGWPRERG